MKIIENLKWCLLIIIAIPIFLLAYVFKKAGLFDQIETQDYTEATKYKGFIDRE